MSKIAILTAIYDDYDTLKPTIEQSVEVEWICVTDNPKLYDPHGKWDIVYEPRSHLHPNRAAKTPKCLPWLYTDAQQSIWIDASFQVKNRFFAEDAMSMANPIAQFNHPWRQCAYAEAEECIAIPKYEPSVLKEQMWDLRNVQGHPHNWGLWATGVMARKHTDEVVSAGFDWLEKIYRFTYQDQVSYPDVLRRHGLRPMNFPGTHFDNQWVEYQGSGRH